MTTFVTVTSWTVTSGTVTSGTVTFGTVTSGIVRVMGVRVRFSGCSGVLEVTVPEVTWHPRNKISYCFFLFELTDRTFYDNEDY